RPGVHRVARVRGAHAPDPPATPRERVGDRCRAPEALRQRDPAAHARARHGDRRGAGAPPPPPAPPPPRRPGGSRTLLPPLEPRRATLSWGTPGVLRNALARRAPGLPGAG